MAREIYPNSPNKLLKIAPLFSMQKELSRMFDDFYGVENTKGISTFTPRLDIHESDKEILIYAEVPGIDENDIEVSFKDGYLNIRGEKKSSHSEEKEGRKYSERSYGSFERVISLPENVKEDGIEANSKNGVLEIKIPKETPVEATPKKIQVKKIN